MDPESPYDGGAHFSDDGGSHPGSAHGSKQRSSNSYASSARPGKILTNNLVCFCIISV